ncbi:hypothetical protein GCM10025331_61210 [Actinoplanes utahensis]|nr:hypothetical protein Aut01nite_85000 [Actinoplanes utahensis]
MSVLEMEGAGLSDLRTPYLVAPADLHQLPALETSCGCPLADPIRSAEIVAAGDSLQQEQLSFAELAPTPCADSGVDVVIRAREPWIG